MVVEPSLFVVLSESVVVPEDEPPLDELFGLVYPQTVQVLPEYS